MTLEARVELERGGFRLAAELRCPAAAVTVLTGPSGGGKTSLLRAIAGLEGGARGRLEVDGRVWLAEGGALPAHRRELGYVFQEPSLFAHLSVRGNLEYGWSRVPPGARAIGFDAVVESLGLAPLLDRAPEELSGGERQRVAIGRALLTSPRLLLLDEPVSSLDRRGRGEVLDALERSIRGGLDITTVYVTHAADEVARLADRVAWVDGGRVVAAGPVETMLTRLDLPLARGPEAEAVMRAEVTGRDDEFSLNTLRFAGGELRVAGPPLAIGRDVRLRLLARDVSLTLEPARDTSILNVFPATVRELSAEEEGQVLVRLEAGGAPLLARITRRSARDLELATGRPLYAQVKSVALLEPSAVGAEHPT